MWLMRRRAFQSKQSNSPAFTDPGANPFQFNPVSFQPSQDQMNIRNCLRNNTCGPSAVEAGQTPPSHIPGDFSPAPGVIEGFKGLF